MSRSDIARTRGQSVLEAFEEDRLLMPGGLPKRNDANAMPSFLDNLGVDDRHDNAIGEPERDEALLAVAKPVVFVRERHAGEDPRRVGEIDAVTAQVLLALAFGPRELELYSQLYIHVVVDATLGIFGAPFPAGHRPDG
jgi:hypothetical protein